MNLIIESEGYLPYTVNINIPNQNYFYELYQEIILKPIKQFGIVVGQEISVKNAFHNVREGRQNHSATGQRGHAGAERQLRFVRYDGINHCCY